MTTTQRVSIKQSYEFYHNVNAFGKVTSWTRNDAGGLIVPEHYAIFSGPASLVVDDAGAWRDTVQRRGVPCAHHQKAGCLCDREGDTPPIYASWHGQPGNMPAMPHLRHENRITFPVLLFADICTNTRYNGEKCCHKWLYREKVLDIACYPCSRNWQTYETFYNIHKYCARSDISFGKIDALPVELSDFSKWSAVDATIPAIWGTSIGHHLSQIGEHERYSRYRERKAIARALESAAKQRTIDDAALHAEIQKQIETHGMMRCTLAAPKIIEILRDTTKRQKNRPFVRMSSDELVAALSDAGFVMNRFRLARELDLIHPSILVRHSPTAQYDTCTYEFVPPKAEEPKSDVYIPTDVNGEKILSLIERNQFTSKTEVARAAGMRKSTFVAKFAEFERRGTVVKTNGIYTVKR